MPRKISLVALGAVVLFLACIGHAVPVHGADDGLPDDGAVNEFGNSCTNLQHAGYVSQQGEAVYFIFNRAIYRRVGGEKPQRLVGQRAQQLNVVGDSLYYSNVIRGIFRFDMRTGRETKLSNNDASFMLATKDHIYYVNQSDKIRIYRLKTDGSEDTKLIDIGCNSFGMGDGYIYLTEYHDGKPEVIAVSLETLEKKTVADNARFFTMLGDRVVISAGPEKHVLTGDGGRVPLDSKGYTYYTHDRRWSLNNMAVGYLYAVTDGVKKTLVKKPCFNINSTDGKIFFMEFSEKDDEVYSYCINPNGTGKQKLDDFFK